MVQHSMMVCRGIGVHRTCLWHLPKVGPKVIESDQKWQKVTKSEHLHLVVFNKDFDKKTVWMQCHNALQRHWCAQNMLVTPPKSWSKSDRKWSKVTKSDKKWAFTPFSSFEQIFLKKPSLNARQYSVTMPCRGICVHKTWMWHIPKVGPKVTESDQKWQKVTKSENKTFTPFKKESTLLKKKHYPLLQIYLLGWGVGEARGP